MTSAPGIVHFLKTFNFYLDPFETGARLSLPKSLKQTKVEERGLGIGFEIWKLEI